MNSEKVEYQGRDPFQKELLNAVQRRRERTQAGKDDNNNFQTFDGQLNAKMSRYSKKPMIQKHQFQFGSDDEEEEDDVFKSGLNKSSQSNELNLSQKSDKFNMKNSMDRNSFLSAFLDKDQHVKEASLPPPNRGKSVGESAVPIPRTRPSNLSSSKEMEPEKDLRTNNITDRRRDNKELEKPKYHASKQFKENTSKKLDENNNINNNDERNKQSELQKFDFSSHKTSSHPTPKNRSHRDLDSNNNNLEKSILNKSSLESDKDSSKYERRNDGDSYKEKLENFKRQMNRPDDRQSKYSNQNYSNDPSNLKSPRDRKDGKISNDENRTITRDSHEAGYEKTKEDLHTSTDQKPSPKQRYSITKHKSPRTNREQKHDEGNSLSFYKNKDTLQEQKYEDPEREINMNDKFHIEKKETHSDARTSKRTDSKQQQEHFNPDEELKFNLLQDNGNIRKKTDTVNKQKQAEAQLRPEITPRKRPDVNRKDEEKSSNNTKERAMKTPERRPKTPEKSPKTPERTPKEKNRRETISNDKYLENEREQMVKPKTPEKTPRERPRGESFIDESNGKSKEKGTLKSTFSAAKTPERKPRESKDLHTSEFNNSKTPEKTPRERSKKNSILSSNERELSYKTQEKIPTRSGEYDENEKRQFSQSRQERTPRDGGSIRNERRQSNQSERPQLLKRQNKLEEHSLDEKQNDNELDDIFDAGPQRSSTLHKQRKQNFAEENEKEKSSSLRKNIKKPESKERLPKKKGPMKADLPLEQVTKSPALKSTLKQEQKKDNENKPLSATHRTRSLSFNNISNISPSPRTTSPSTYDMSTMDAETLREQIYADWLQRKRSFTKEETKNLTQKKRTEVEEKERLKIERMKDARKSFDAWNDRKSEVLKSKKRTERENEKQLKEKEDEKLQKKLEAQKYFDSWKQQKDENLKESHSKKKRTVKENEKKEMSDKIERAEDAKKIFEKWKSHKDEQLRETKRKERVQKKKQLQDDEHDKQERKQQASRSFEAWKEKVESRPSSASLQQRPWCPSSRQRSSGIPDGVQPVIIRDKPPGKHNRAMSASGRLQTNSRRSK